MIRAVQPVVRNSTAFVPDKWWCPAADGLDSPNASRIRRGVVGRRAETNRPRTLLKELQMRFLVALLTVVSVAMVVNAQTPGRSATPARGQAAAQAPPPKPVTTALFFDKEKVARTFAKGGNLVNAPDMIVLLTRRFPTRTGVVELSLSLSTKG